MGGSVGLPLFAGVQHNYAERSVRGCLRPIEHGPNTFRRDDIFQYALMRLDFACHSVGGVLFALGVEVVMAYVLSCGVTSAVACLCVIASAFAGDLTPPPGAPAPTMKPLSQVEPRIPVSSTTTPGNASNTFRITQPGSYYLVGNVTGESGKTGISIEASNVTLDLSGFALTGVAGSINGIDAVATDADNLVVVNGTVTGWGGVGIDLFSTSGTGGRIEGVNVTLCGGFGMRSSTGGIITRCTASDNTSIGIVGVNNSLVEHCVSHSNSGDGISCGTGSLVQSCMVLGNTGDGIDLSSDSTALDCQVRTSGIVGIAASSNCTIARCTSVNNILHGIQAGNRAKIDACNNSDNGNDGIQVTSDASVTNCNATLNTNAGIHATGTGNRIDMNHVNENNKGVDCDAGGNIVTRNTARGNTTSGFEFAAGNINAQVLFLTTQFNDASPWANIVY